MVFLSYCLHITNVFLAKSTEVGRKYAEALSSEILVFGLQIGRNSVSAFFITCGLHSVELGFLEKTSCCITT